MIRMSILLASASFGLAPLASADHNNSYSFGSQHNPYPATVKSGCEQVREERQIAGAQGFLEASRQQRQGAGAAARLPRPGRCARG